MPAPSVKHTDYGLVYDPKRRALIYVTSPGYHQMGVAHVYDGRTFTPLTSDTYRLGSQHGPWSTVYDSARGAVVSWGFDYDSGPYGAVIGDGRPSVVLHESALASHASMARKDPTIVVAGDMPGVPVDDNAWDDLHGIIGYDARRRVTVCVSQRGIFELSGARWARVAEAPKLPTDAGGDRGYKGGAGAVWNAKTEELVVWIVDADDGAVVFGAWNGSAWRSIATKGLPEELWSRWGKAGFAVGDHPEHGVVVYAGPAHGLFGLGAKGFVAVPNTTAGDAPPRSLGGQLAWDAAREVLVHGPCVTKDGDQNALWELHPSGWTRIGASKKPSLLDSLSSGWLGYARHRGAMHAVGLYANVIAWDDATNWRAVVDSKAGDMAREDGRVQAVVTAWDGVLHAVMDDGGVLALGERGWVRKAAASSVWKDTKWPLLGFDRVRGVIVGWGSSKAKSGRKNDTYTFDGTAWTKVKTAKSKPADLDVDAPQAFDLFWDAGAKQVARLGATELAHFDGKDWVGKRLVNAKLFEAWRRCADPETGALHVVNVGQKTVAAIAGGKVSAVGTIESPMTDPHRDQNLPFDRWWWDDVGRRLIVHADDDADDTYALALG